ncbi:hypothetical protein K474DRAFT_894499 [Panus rudis PR-1116 ss-1]|nr:hypothetical protein K474DRAFT_894499 [Panus rudis PR-1116 ss-1]
MRLSTVYALALASGITPAVLAIPVDIYRGNVVQADEANLLPIATLASRANILESDVQSLLRKVELHKRTKDGSRSGSSTNRHNPMSGTSGKSSSSSLLNRIGGQATQQQSSPSLLNRLGPQVPAQPQAGGSLLDRLEPVAGSSSSADSHHVNVQFPGRYLSAQPDKQTATLDRMEKFMRQSSNAAKLQKDNTQNLIINQSVHQSESMNRKPHDTAVTYTSDGNLKRVVHLGDKGKGTIESPKDQTFAERW